MVTCLTYRDSVGGLKQRVGRGGVVGGAKQVGEGRV